MFFCFNSSIQVNPRCYKCEVTSYYLISHLLCGSFFYFLTLMKCGVRGDLGREASTIVKNYSIYIFLQCLKSKQRVTDSMHLPPDLQRQNLGEDYRGEIWCRSKKKCGQAFFSQRLSSNFPSIIFLGIRL